MTSYLSKLPDELCLNIVSFINDGKSLRSLAVSSRKFQSLAEPAIYSTFLLRTSQECQHLEHSIESSPRRATYIRSLDLRPISTQGVSDYGKTITKILHQCTGIRELTLESPTCNYGRWASGHHGWKDIQVNIAPSLMQALDLTSTRGLTKLVLHLDGERNRYWDPNAGHENSNVVWSTVMALGTLTELTLSCACIHDSISTGERRSTDLKRLTLIECNVTTKGLNKMLSAPKTLEQLYLGENAFHDSQGYDIPREQPRSYYNELFAQDPNAFITALAQQKDSLQKFTYIPGGSQQPKAALLGDFKEFTKLCDVALYAGTRDLQTVMLSHDGPPGLVSLRLDVASTDVFGELRQIHDEINTSEQVLTPDDVSTRMAHKVSSILLPRFSSTTLQRLQHLHVVLTTEIYVYNTMPLKLRQQWIRLVNEHWSKHGVKLFFYERERTSVFPPILFGEKRRAPRDVLFYSSDSGFIEANTDSQAAYEQYDSASDEDEDEDEEIYSEVSE